MVLMAFNCLRYFADKPMGSKYTWGANTFWPPAHLNSWDILGSTWILWSRAIIFQCLSHSCDLPFSDDLEQICEFKILHLFAMMDTGQSIMDLNFNI